MYDPLRHHRRSTRLQNFDYSDEGPYFVTICVHERRCLFGDVVVGEMRLNAIGRAIEEEWKRLPERFSRVVLDEFVVMPNHLHGLLGICGPGRGEACLRPVSVADPKRSSGNAEGEDKLRPYGTMSDSLGRVVQAFKSLTTNVYIAGVKTGGWPRFNKHLWQPNYYDHIVRNNRALDLIRDYIFTNPERWEADHENPLGDGSDELHAFVRSLELQFQQPEAGEDKLRSYEGRRGLA
jgi:REP element-mobilizing transposase RayT